MLRNTRFKRFLLATAWVMVLAAGTQWIQVQSQAATPLQPPAIILFESDLSVLTVDAAESGETTVTLSWHVIHFLGIHRLRLETFSFGQWLSALDDDDTISPVDTREVKIHHPGNFGPTSFRLSLLDTRGMLLDQQTLVIPYRIDGTPIIEEFLVTADSIDIGTLESGRARILVSWRISGRLPTSNLLFEQVNVDGSAVSIELDRERLWVASAGTGLTAPVMPAEGSVLRIRLRVMDVVTAEVYDELVREVTIGGVPIPTRRPTDTP